MESRRLERVESVRAVIDFIEEHLDSSLSLDQTAAAVHYSKYHLHRIFSSMTGMTIHDYAVRRRLTEGARLLAESSRPVLEIALSCGYESQQAFTGAFKEMYKLTPARYRTQGIFYPLQLPLALQEQGGFEEFSFAELSNGSVSIRFSEEADIPAWLELARQCVDGYPCLNEGEYLQWLRKRIHEKQAMILKNGDMALGVLGFSKETGNIDFMGIHPQHRKRGAAELLLGELADRYLPGREISMTTYREHDRADTGWRAGLKRLGFEEREELVEFGYPTQRFVLPAHRCRFSASWNGAVRASGRCDSVAVDDGRSRASSDSSRGRLRAERGRLRER